MRGTHYLQFWSTACITFHVLIENFVPSESSIPHGVTGPDVLLPLFTPFSFINHQKRY